MPPYGGYQLSPTTNACFFGPVPCPLFSCAYGFVPALLRGSPVLRIALQLSDCFEHHCRSPWAREALHEYPDDVLGCTGSQDNTSMKQSSLGLSNTVKCTRKREFLDAMELVVPWTELVSLIEP